MRSIFQLYAVAAEAQPLLMDCLNSLVLWTAGDYAAQRIEKKGIRLRRLLSTSFYGFFLIAPFGHYWCARLRCLQHRPKNAGRVEFLTVQHLLASG